MRSYLAYLPLLSEIYSCGHNGYILFEIIYVRRYHVHCTTVVNPSSVDVYPDFPVQDKLMQSVPICCY